MLAEQYLRVVRQNLPVIDSIIREYGELTLCSYLQALPSCSDQSCQPRDDLFQTVHQYLVALLGAELADSAVAELARKPVVVTTNHHGVDYFSQSVQGSILVGLERVKKRLQPSFVFVFSCGNVPLNASSYPRGLLLYEPQSSEEINDIPMRVPIFPDRLKRCVTAAAPAIAEPMIARGKAVLSRMALDGRLSEPMLLTALEILDRDYGATLAADLSTYSDQAIVINHRLFSKFFKDGILAPHLVYLELERVVGALLPLDLNKADTLVHRVLFVEEIRQALTALLDGERGCWHRIKLKEGLREPAEACLERQAPPGSGTMFFWGIDDFKRRVALSLVEGNMLVGRDDHGELWKLPFTPEAITEGLLQRRLLPSLFTCFLALSFARGMVCIGGYYQGRYLPRMQEAIVAALLKHAASREMAQSVAGVPTRGYLDSMSAFLVPLQERYLVPAGPVEILKAGGIGPRELEQMLALTVREAHLAALFETVPDAIPPGSRSAGWKKQLAADLVPLLGEKTIAR